MFGDDSDVFLRAFEDLLEDFTLEEILEMEDLEPAEALYHLFLSGNVRSPFEADS